MMEKKRNFIKEKIDKRLEISAHQWNSVFMEFQDKFHSNNKYQTARRDFIKLMYWGAYINGHSVVEMPVRGADRHDYGIRKLHSILYTNPHRTEQLNKEI